MFTKSLFAALCLLSALTAQAASLTTIAQSQLPFTISTAGTYVLTGNMSYTSGSTFGAINIIGSIAGPVILDLKGFTLTGNVANDTAGVVIFGGIGTYPITIRNGTITTFANGINAGGQDVFNGTSISNITVKSVTFNQDQTGVSFHQFVNSSAVSNCTFNSCGSGIIDSQSIGGNSYNNNTFGVNAVALIVDTYSDLTAPVLNRCQFAPPPITNLLTSAIAAPVAPKSASILILSLPFTITAPGAYVLTGNLDYNGGGINPAISINGPIAGPVVVDLKGFTITSDVAHSNVCVSISGNTGLYPITIRNGTITKFEEGIYANSVSNITVNNIVFNENYFAVSLAVVDSSTIYNCTFNSNIFGLEDINGTGGNSYNNNNFGIGGTRALYIQSSNTPLVLDRCDFAAPSLPPTP
jgi:hypothetical protein